jgi:hypothetical protein
MHIDWYALVVVSAVSIVATVVFIALLAAGIRFLSLATVRSNQGQPATAARTSGYGFLGVAGLLVLYGLYLIIPLFH